MRGPDGNGLPHPFRINLEADFSNIVQFDVGPKEHECPDCHALLWDTETPSLCCGKGKVRLPPRRQPPEPLRSLFSGQHPLSAHFISKARAYNNVFALASTRANLRTFPTGPSNLFVAGGRVYHRVGPLTPATDAEGQQLRPSFGQIYILGGEEREAQARSDVMQGLNADLVREIQQCMHQHNPFVQAFVTFGEQHAENPAPNVALLISSNMPDRQYGRPTAREVAVFIPGEHAVGVVFAAIACIGTYMAYHRH